MTQPLSPWRAETDIQSKQGFNYPELRVSIERTACTREGEKGKSQISDLSLGLSTSDSLFTLLFAKVCKSVLWNYMWCSQGKFFTFFFHERETFFFPSCETQKQNNKKMKSYFYMNHPTLGVLSHQPATESSKRKIVRCSVARESFSHRPTLLCSSCNFRNLQ